MYEVKQKGSEAGFVQQRNSHTARWSKREAPDTQSCFNLSESQWTWASPSLISSLSFQPGHRSCIQHVNSNAALFLPGCSPMKTSACLQDTKHKSGADSQLPVERQTSRQTERQADRQTGRMRHSPNDYWLRFWMCGFIACVHHYRLQNHHLPGEASVCSNTAS